MLQALRAKYKRRAIDAAQRVAQLEAALAEERARRAELEAAAGRERAHLAELEAGAGHERERLVEQHIQNLQDVEAKMLAAQAR